MNLLHEKFLTDEEKEIVELITECNDDCVADIEEWANSNIICDLIFLHLDFYRCYYKEESYNKLKYYLYDHDTDWKDLLEHYNVVGFNDLILKLEDIIEQKNNEIKELKKLLNIIK